MRLAVAALVLLAVAGCGSTPERGASVADLAKGRGLFQAGAPQGCSFCHTLAAADTTSALGPNLDDEMRETDHRSKSDAALASYVRGWIERGDCVNPTDASRCMPARVFTGDEAAAVADFVAVCGRSPAHAGCAPEPGPLRGAALRGRQLFQTHGCVSCHFSNGGASAGPPLVGVAGSRVELSDGRTVRADRSYLVESIASPDRLIVAGYQRGAMSAWVAPQHLTRTEIAALATYLETLH